MARKKKDPVFPQGEQLAQFLPGEAVIDDALLEHVVRRVNEIQRNKVMETAREIGEYLLETFFGGDLEQFRAKGKKHASLRALAARDDLAVSASALWYSIAELDQLRLLPAEIGSALPMSHHRLLLPVKDETLKTGLAKDAVEHHLTKRDLEARIKSMNYDAEPTDGPGPGRPALPGWAKGLGSARKAIEAAVAHEVTSADLVHHGKKLAQARLDEVNQTIAMLEGLRSKLEVALGST